ncbi:hypothetical protein [Vitiosangium sp. GDMCC 1.1324]|uniref:hypothetical protein n=1 Tax=Vitiosangium sp. (strain GDMCC 1.1324) TaxID=2138576 RepID=UPI000D350BE3|nr:hypothetical protein [Vitiosangium sp. GDMCC 1.1324]PTL80110.1 hypothetical protein DAT35_29240 [Vitiosangium sp. GDMCC 1.1324]
MVEEARARLAEAQAVTQRTKEDEASTERLFQRGVVSRMEWSRSQTELERSLAAEEAARAALARVRFEGATQSTERRTRIAALQGRLPA